PSASPTRNAAVPSTTHIGWKGSPTLPSISRRSCSGVGGQLALPGLWRQDQAHWVAADQTPRDGLVHRAVEQSVRLHDAVVAETALAARRSAPWNPARRSSADGP